MNKYIVKLKKASEATDYVTKFLNDSSQLEIKNYADFNKLIWVEEYINSRVRGLFDKEEICCQSGN